MFKEYEDKIKAEAIKSYPEEAVWLITNSGCKKVKNISPTPTKTFKVSKQEMGKAIASGLLAVVHSHPDYPDCPSESDMKGQIASGVPWGVVATNGEITTDIRWWGENIERKPLIGRGFCHGINDCYGLIRDYYRQELGISLVDFPRDWEWWLNGKDLYQDGIVPAGFRKIEQAEATVGDMWIAQVRSPVPNHGGILLENGLALHHPCGNNPVDPTRLSIREPIGRWLPHITLWLRHNSR